MDRRKMLKGLGATVAGAATLAACDTQPKNVVVKHEYEVSAQLQEIIAAVEAGVDIDDTEAFIIACELNRRCGENYEQAMSEGWPDVIKGSREERNQFAVNRGLELFSALQKNTNNLIKVRPFVKHTLFKFVSDIPKRY